MTGIRNALVIALVMVLLGQTIQFSGCSRESATNINSHLPEASYILLYENVLAGRYSCLRIGEDGRVEFVVFNRMQEILDHKVGKVTSEAVDEMYSFMIGNGFLQMDNIYDIYPLPSGSSTVYEDVYYWVAIEGGIVHKTVLSHEHALPTKLADIIATLREAITQLADPQILGTFVFAGSTDILEFKWLPDQPLPTVELDEQDAQRYQFLQKALSDLFSLVHIGTSEKESLQQLLPEGTQIFNVISSGGNYTVKILHRI